MMRKKRVTNVTETAHRQKVSDTILASLAGGSTTREACDASNVSYVTWYRWCLQDDKLQELYDEIRDSRVNQVEDKMYLRLVNGEASSQEYVFYLKNRQSRRWKDSSDVTIGGEVSVKQQIQGFAERAARATQRHD